MSNSGAGFPVVLSAPSGGGKDSVAAGLAAAVPFLRKSRSTTTRAPRSGEVEGREYEFVSGEEFDRRREAGAFAEWAEVHGARYGTASAFLHATCAAGACPLLVIDVQGGMAIRRAHPDAVQIFLMPHALPEIERRLRARGTENEAGLARRLANARGEIAAALDYDYHVVNESIDLATGQVAHVIMSEREARTK